MMVDLLTCLSMDTVNALSSCMNMSIYGNGTVKEFYYEGCILLGEWTEKTKQKDGISITFTPDESIFGPVQATLQGEPCNTRNGNGRSTTLDIGTAIR